MLTLHLKSGRKKTFNLKLFEREKSMRDAWHSMHGDPKYADKKFRVTTREGDRFEVNVDDIVLVEYQEAEYYKVSPEEVHA